MTKMNRTYKDSVFSLYFGEKTERLVELYNALNCAHYPPDTKVEINTLEDAIFMDRINDCICQLKNGLSDALITDIFGCNRGELEQIKRKL